MLLCIFVVSVQRRVLQSLVIGLLLSLVVRLAVLGNMWSHTLAMSQKISLKAFVLLQRVNLPKGTCSLTESLNGLRWTSSAYVWSGLAGSVAPGLH